MNIYLIGFMGAGKSTIGKLLARRLKRGFCDTDELVEARAGRPITAIFAQEGETRFRALERQVIEELSQKNGQVVALGGGAPLREENWQTISSTGTTIYLRADPGILFRRLEEEGSRPLLRRLEGQDRLAEIKRLLEMREPYYRRADEIVECQDRSAGELVNEILERLKDAHHQG